MSVRPLSPDSRRKMPACPVPVLRRTFAVLALPGCALAFTSGSIAADTSFVSGTDPLSGGEGMVARPPGGFEGGAYSGALQVRSIWEMPAEAAARSVGGSGTVASVVAAAVSDGMLAPTSLIAETR